MNISDLDEVMGTPLVKQIDYKKSGLSRDIREQLFASLDDELTNRYR